MESLNRTIYGIKTDMGERQVKTSCRRNEIFKQQIRVRGEKETHTLMVP